MKSKAKWVGQPISSLYGRDPAKYKELKGCMCSGTGEGRVSTSPRCNQIFKWKLCNDSSD